MKEVNWIFGNSATGKETFIRHATDENEEELLRTLGWVGKKIVACAASTRNIGQYEDDPITELREDILTEVPSLLAVADVVLVKWQGVDSRADRILRLRSALPAVRHKVLQIVTPDEELYTRLVHKSWWDTREDVRSFVTEEHEYILDYTAYLLDQIPVTKISGASGANYALVC